MYSLPVVTINIWYHWNCNFYFGMRRHSVVFSFYGSIPFQRLEIIIPIRLYLQQPYWLINWLEMLKSNRNQSLEILRWENCRRPIYISFLLLFPIEPEWCRSVELSKYRVLVRERSLDGEPFRYPLHMIRLNPAKWQLSIHRLNGIDYMATKWHRNHNSNLLLLNYAIASFNITRIPTITIICKSKFLRISL